jgi:Arc/MetJ family transcription regulator
MEGRVNLGDTVKAKVKVSAIIEIDDEIRKDAKEQCGITDDQEIADRVLKILVKEAICERLLLGWGSENE